MSQIPKCNQGLTLIELVIVVAVLGLLATIGYPLYRDQTTKARRADAKVVLQSVALAQERFFTANGSYAANLSSLPLNSVELDTATGVTGRGYYTVTIAGGGQTFALTAVPVGTGPQANDSVCADFTLDHVGTKGATNPDKCW